MYTDLLNRRINVGDYVVSYNHIYAVLEVGGRGYAKIVLLNASKTTRPLKRFCKELCIVPIDDVMNYIETKHQK